MEETNTVSRPETFNASKFHAKVNAEAKEIAEWLVNMEVGSGVWSVALRYALKNIVNDPNQPMTRRMEAKRLINKLFYASLV